MGLLNCCCSFDLKTRCIILGIKSAILSFILFIIMIVNSIELGSTTIETWFHKDSSNVSFKLTGLYITSIVLVFMFLAKCLLDLYLVYGVLMERPKFMKTYFIMWLVFIVLFVFIISFNSNYYGEGTLMAEGVFLVINVSSIAVSICFYMRLNTQPLEVI